MFGFVTVLFDMGLKLRGRLTFKVQVFVTVLFDMVLKHQNINVLDTLCFVTVLIDMGLKHKMYLIHLYGVFFYFTVSNL